VDGHLQALAIIDALRSHQPIHGSHSSTPSTRHPAIYYPARHLPGGNEGDFVLLKKPPAGTEVVSAVTDADATRSHCPIALGRICLKYKQNSRKTENYPQKRLPS
jgi:hypothetical protein